MKKEYIKPVVVGERFVASEYVAACVVGKCDITSKKIYLWDDKDGDGAYDNGEEGWKLWSTNEACDSDDFQSLSGQVEDTTPVVCFESWIGPEDTGKYVGTIVGWRFSGMGPYGYSTHVSSVKPYASNAS